jgi:cytoskeleton protein RodZ
MGGPGLGAIETEGGRSLKDPQDLTVGKFLQQERERKGLSLEAVAKVTRISLKSLEALEGNEFIALPAPIFIRGFLKTYGSFLGLNSDKIIALYESQTGMIGVSSANGTQPEKRLPRMIFFIVIPFLIVLIGGGIYWFSSSRKADKLLSIPSPAPSPATAPEPEKSPSPPPKPSPSKEVAKAPEKVQPAPKREVRLAPTTPLSSPPPPSTSSAVNLASPSDEQRERRHILRVQAREQTWVRVQTDGQPEFEVLLEPKEKAVWTARQEMKITLGNAGGVDMTFNGKKVRGFGESGQVVHLQFPQDATKKGE